MHECIHEYAHSCNTYIHTYIHVHIQPCNLMTGILTKASQEATYCQSWKVKSMYVLFLFVMCSAHRILCMRLALPVPHVLFCKSASDDRQTDRHKLVQHVHAAFRTHVYCAPRFGIACCRSSRVNCLCIFTCAVLARSVYTCVLYAGVLFFPVPCTSVYCIHAYVHLHMVHRLIGG